MNIVKRLSRFSIFPLLKVISWISRFLPWRLGVALGSGIGLLFFLASRRYRMLAFENYKIAFGLDQIDPSSHEIIKRSFRNLGKSLVEILTLQHLTPSRFNSLILWEGEEYLKQAEGEGIVLITGHIGNWELMGAALATRGYRLHAIAAPLYDARINQFIINLRARFNVGTINRGTPSSSRKILEILRKKEILALLIDQDTRVNGVFVPFFNKKAYTPTGAAQLALRSNAKTVVAFITRLSDGRHRITIQKPLTLFRTGDVKQNIAVNTALFTVQLEQHIRTHPDQWVWMHRRWKTQPTDDTATGCDPSERLS